jgi:catechol 2,3-dioxygenase-like lactoylglutathione lyase family enzyme
MPLHRLTQIVMGVPNVEQTAAYYAEFGLTPGEGHTFSTADGGVQLRIVPAAHRRLVQLGIGADDPDDLERIAASLGALDVPVQRTAAGVRAVEPGTEVTVQVEIAGRYQQDPTPTPDYNSPGITARAGQRAPGILREQPVRPRKLGHVVLGSSDQQASQEFFQRGLHNVLVQQAPVPYLHHTSWQVDDIDEVGRGASAMLAADPARHVWGLGRHYVGSNFFWYLRDPAGNFSEYYSDLDCIVDDALWKPGVWEGPQGLYSWGPPPPPSFLAPEDLAALMTGAHSPR